MAAVPVPDTNEYEALDAANSAEWRVQVVLVMRFFTGQVYLFEIEMKELVGDGDPVGGRTIRVHSPISVEMRRSPGECWH
jgi:hypothetical protein